MNIKATYHILFIILCTSGLCHSQVSIGNTNAANGSSLHVDDYSGQKGVILTRSNIADLTTVAPFPAATPEGTLTFNTNVASGIGYVWWDPTVPTWRRVDPFISVDQLYTNPVSDGAAGNLNQDISVGFKIPLFGNPQLADPDNLYELVTPIPPEGNFKNIRVNAAGRYRVAVTLGLEAQEDGTGIDDNIVEVRLQITDVYGNVRLPGAFQHSTEMEGTASGQDDDGAVSFVEVIEINEDDVISVLSYQSSSTGNASVELNGSRPSSFYLIKIN